MKRKKSKKRNIPKKLIFTEQFEFAIPSTTPEEYIAYLEEVVNNLLLFTEDGNLVKSGDAAHSSFTFTNYVNRSDLWTIGKIYSTDQTTIKITGTMGLPRGDIMSLELSATRRMYPQA